MPTVTVPISERAHETLRSLAERDGQPVETVLDRAIEEYRRKTFLDQANEAFRALRDDPEAWRSEQEERALWDVALLDTSSEQS